jgi:FixJ family two-component response regulator
MQAICHHDVAASVSRAYHNRPSPHLHVVKPAQLTNEVVYLVDDDARIRESLCEFLETCGIEARCFESARQYIDCNRTDAASCLVLDLRLPEVSGLELQHQLIGKPGPPIIFISGQADIATSVHAIKAGAIEFLTKPVDPDVLWRSIQNAFAIDRAQRKRRAELELLRERFSRLTPREQQVLPLVVGGLLNKQAACVLGISEITLQIHRRQVMRKMEAESLADLVRMALKLRIPDWRHRQLDSSQAGRSAQPQAS